MKAVKWAAPLGLLVLCAGASSLYFEPPSEEGAPAEDASSAPSPEASGGDAAGSLHAERTELPQRAEALVATPPCDACPSATGAADATEKECAVTAAEPEKPTSWDPAFGFFDDPATLAKHPFFNPDKKSPDRDQRRRLKELVHRVHSDLGFVDENIRAGVRSELARRVEVGDVTRVPAVAPGERLSPPPCPYPAGKYGVRVRMMDDPESDDKLVVYVPKDEVPGIRQSYEERERLYQDFAEEIRRFFRDL